MTSRLGGVVLGVILSLTGLYPVPAQEAAPPRISLYALLSAPSDSAVVADAAKRWNVRVTRHAFGVLSLAIRADSLTLDRRALLDSLRSIRRADGTPAVEGAEFDQSAEVQSTGGEALPSWGLDSLRVAGAWSQGVTGEGVTVGVIDTGFDPSHPEFAGRVAWAGSSTSGIDSAPGASLQVTSDCKHHGSHVAGTIAGATRGVAPGARIAFVRVGVELDGRCVAWTSAQVAALQFLTARGVRVVGTSMGGTYSGGHDAVTRAARNAGTLLIGAAGNNDSYVYCPACYDSAIAVAGLTSSLARGSYSNRGPEVDYAAPGSSISAAVGASGFQSKTGTSMAQPHVTGIVALMLAADPSLSPDSIDAILRTCSLDLSTPGHDTATGWGMPRADCAVARARGLDPSPLADSTPLRLARGTSGCKTVSALVPWRTGALPAGLSVELSTNSLCLTAADDVAVGTYTIDLIGVP